MVLLDTLVILLLFMGRVCIYHSLGLNFLVYHNEIYLVTNRRMICGRGLTISSSTGEPPQLFFFRCCLTDLTVGHWVTGMTC